LLAAVCDQDGQLDVNVYNKLILEMQSLYGNIKRAINFKHHSKNLPARLVIPRHNTKTGFLYRACTIGNQWMEEIISLLANGDKGCNKEDADQWIVYYMGLHHESAFTAVAMELGHPIVQRIDPIDAHAMWTDANLPPVFLSMVTGSH
jgi:hypothetical protein